jgi:hypothetical protein
VAPAFTPLAFRVAESLAPHAEGVYVTVTVHDLPGPSEVPVQASDMIENGDGLGSDTVSMAVAEPPELVSVNVSEGV